jgi:hypothetical protein
MDLWVKLDKCLRKKRTFYLFSKVILAVSKVRHLSHLPPLRSLHAGSSEIINKQQQIPSFKVECGGWWLEFSTRLPSAR